ncbi:COG4315 family predicted lipoprotein [Streptomyces cinereoruber]|uniref:COG4315 family predicted lipoprotein n=1 Tax=Streptomyces cinereoruber TaxID=67260 RepID=UPI00362F5DF7
MLRTLPSTLWIVGATVAVAALTPVVGQSVTSAPAPVASASPLPSASPAPTADQEVTKPSPSSSFGTPPTDKVVIQEGFTRLGSIAVDKEGYTLYLSVLDNAKPSESVCLSKKCLEAWKPVYLPNAEVKPQAGKGVSPSLVGSLKRPDGTWQATLGGWPLYRFSKDQAPGEARGEGLKGTWHVIAPNGKKAKLPAP